MNTARKAAVFTKNFVMNHKVTLAIGVTTLTCLKLNKMALRDHDDFLKEHNLYDAFYTPAI